MYINCYGSIFTLEIVYILFHLTAVCHILVKLNGQTGVVVGGGMNVHGRAWLLKIKPEDARL
jgi:hypothetical protein